MKKSIGIFAFFLMAYLLIGCNKSSTLDKTNQYDPETEEGSQTKSQLMIYCEEDQPREFIDQEGELTGLSVELVKEIQKRVGNSDEIQLVPWARGYTEVMDKSNVVLFSMARNKERNDLLQWIGPIDEISYAFYAKADSTLVINSLEDAKKVKSIGVTKDEIREIYLKSQGFTNLERANDTAQNYKKLMNGRIDLMPISTDIAELKSETKEMGYHAEDFKPVYVFMKTQLYIAMSKETPMDIVNAWNSALEEMKQDGTFEKIYNEYFPGKALPGSAITDFQ